MIERVEILEKEIPEKDRSLKKIEEQLKGMIDKFWILFFKI